MITLHTVLSYTKCPHGQRHTFLLKTTYSLHLQCLKLALFLKSYSRLNICHIYFCYFFLKFLIIHCNLSTLTVKPLVPSPQGKVVSQQVYTIRLNTLPHKTKYTATGPQGQWLCRFCCTYVPTDSCSRGLLFNFTLRYDDNYIH